MGWSLMCLLHINVSDGISGSTFSQFIWHSLEEILSFHIVGCLAALETITTVPRALTAYG